MIAPYALLWALLIAAVASALLSAAVACAVPPVDANVVAADRALVCVSATSAIMISRSRTLHFSA